jgi:phosphomannomutase
MRESGAIWMHSLRSCFSGTEPLARVMVEGPRLDRVEHFARSIAAAIRAELGE